MMLNESPRKIRPL